MQGCPLSPFFACLVLVLHILLTDLNASLRLGALTRHANHTFLAGWVGNYGMGSSLLAQTKSYLDDTNNILPYLDPPGFIHTFAE
jgi:hypothetical protein